jgi:DinB superfamily
MTTSVTAEIEAAHDAVVATISRLPNVALDWSPAADEWSIRQIIAHLAHSNDYYITIVEETRAAGFGTVQLRPDSSGWQRMLATDALVLGAASVSEALAHFEHAYEHALAVIAGCTAEELDHPFVFRSWQADADAVTTTLRLRVIATMAEHLREHQGQLSDTLARWQAAT